jgi:hypothetical protein
MKPPLNLVDPTTLTGPNNSFETFGYVSHRLKVIVIFIDLTAILFLGKNYYDTTILGVHVQPLSVTWHHCESREANDLAKRVV